MHNHPPTTERTTSLSMYVLHRNHPRVYNIGAGRGSRSRMAAGRRDGAPPQKQRAGAPSAAPSRTSGALRTDRRQRTAIKIYKTSTRAVRTGAVG